MIKGSITALVTPFKKDLTIDLKAFEELIEWQIEEKTDAILVCGSTGEVALLSHEEQMLLIKHAVQVAKKRIPIIAGTGFSQTSATVEKTQKAKALGADACLVIVPYYVRPTEEGCFAHFAAVNQVGLPMIVYHHPGRTGTKLSPQGFAKIAALEHVMGLKEGTVDINYFLELKRYISIPVYSGDDVLALPHLACGSQGVCSIVGNVIPGLWKEMIDCMLRYELKEGKILFESMYELCRSLVIETNPQCVKYALSLLKKCSPYLRLPLVEPREETKQEISKALQKFYDLKNAKARPQLAESI